MEVPGHPWRRYFARMLDLGLYELPFLAVELLFFHVPIKTFDRWWFQLLNSYLAYGVMLLVEPFLLHFWAATPGKALFGIRVLGADGEKMSLYWARRRTFEVFAYGLGFGLPFYTLYRQYQCWKTVRQGEYNEWEWAWGGRSERMAIPGGFAPCLAWGFVQIVTFSLTVLLVLQSLLPPNRGELTLAEFAENYNFYVRWFSMQTYLMSDQGRLMDNPDRSTSSQLWNDPDAKPIRWSPVYEGDTVVGFRYVLDTDTPYVAIEPDYHFLGVCAFAGSQPETDCFHLPPWRLAQLLKEQDPNFDITYHGIHMVRRVETTGFGETFVKASDLLFAPEGEKGHVYLEFTITKT